VRIFQLKDIAIILENEPGALADLGETLGKENINIVKNIVKKPGSGGNLFRILASEKINIDLIYLAENNRLIIGVDDLEKAKAVL